jgi:hypothetical protein
VFADLPDIAVPDDAVVGQVFQSLYSAPVLRDNE